MRVKTKDPKNDDPGRTIFLGRVNVFFTRRRPEQVAPISIYKNFFVDYFRLPHVFLTLIKQNSQFQFSKISAAHNGVWNAND